MHSSLKIREIQPARADLGYMKSKTKLYPFRNYTLKSTYYYVYDKIRCIWKGICTMEKLLYDLIYQSK